MLVWVVLVLAIIPLLLILLFRKKGEVAHIPSPPSSKILGHIPTMAKAGPISHLAFHKIATEMKEYVISLSLGRKSIVLLSGFEEIKSLHEQIDTRIPFGAVTPLYVGTNKAMGVLFNSGPVAKELRRFTLKSLRDLGFAKTASEESVLNETKTLCEELENISKTKQGVDLDKTFNKAALNVIWNLVSGERYDYSHAKMQKLIDFADVFMLMGRQIIGKPLGNFPILRFLPPFRSLFQKSAKGMMELRSFIRSTISEHESTIDVNNPRDFIDMFLVEMGDKEDTMGAFTKENMVITCLDLFVAGSETTSKSLMFAVALLVRHPEVQAQLQEELDSVISGEMLTMSDRPNLPFTEATINEIWRFGPVAPVSPPRLTNKPAKAGSVTIPSGVVVISNSHTVHRDPKNWDNPHIFDPSRFINNQGQFEANEKNMPFGLGKRRCLGESLARMEMFLFFANIFHRFEFSGVEGDLPSLDHQGGFTNGLYPFRVHIQPRF